MPPKKQQDPTRAERLKDRGVTWSRSPSERFILFKLSEDQQLDPGAIFAMMEGLGVLMPPSGVGYVQYLDDDFWLRCPDNFVPRDLSNTASQRYLHSHGIWDLWHPDRAVEDMYRIFYDQPLREHTESMLTARFGTPQIRQLLGKYFSFDCLDASLSLYQQIFWDLKHFTTDEIELVKSDLRNTSALRKAFNVPTTHAGKNALLAELGYATQRQSLRKMSLDVASELSSTLVEMRDSSVSKKVYHLKNITETLERLVHMEELFVASTEAEAQESFNSRLGKVRRKSVEHPTIGDLTEEGFEPKGLPRPRLELSEHEDAEVVDFKEVKDGKKQ